MLTRIRSQQMSAPVFRLMCLVLLALAIAGCRREDIRVYDAPKEKRASRIPTPPGWEELAPGERAASRYSISGEGGARAEVTVSALPAGGNAADELANVNRWRRQIGLEEIPADQLAGERERIQIAGHAGSLFDIAGTMGGAKTRILGAMQNRGNAVWFFKMTGDDALVADQKDAFVQFAAAYPLPHDHDHDEHGQPTAAASEPAPAPPEAAPSPAAAADNSRWSAPEGWVAQQPGAMQDAKFAVANGKATMAISIFGGTGGGLRENVDRWRGQLGLQPATDEQLAKEVTSLDLPEGKATVVDLTGPTQRMVTVIVRRGPQSWFFKLMGEPAAVAAEKNKLIEFVKTTK
jgi:hypothetical protein